MVVAVDDRFMSHLDQRTIHLTCRTEWARRGAVAVKPPTAFLFRSEVQLQKYLIYYRGDLEQIEIHFLGRDERGEELRGRRTFSKKLLGRAGDKFYSESLSTFLWLWFCTLFDLVIRPPLAVLYKSITVTLHHALNPQRLILLNKCAHVRSICKTSRHHSESDYETHSDTQSESIPFLITICSETESNDGSVQMIWDN